MGFPDHQKSWPVPLKLTIAEDPLKGHWTIFQKFFFLTEFHLSG